MPTTHTSSLRFPLRITLRGVMRNEYLELHVARHALKLSRFSDRIDRCLVTIQCLQPDRRHGRQYVVRVELRLPGADLVAGSGEQAFLRLGAAIHEAFEAVAQRLDQREERARSRRRVTGDHSRMPTLGPMGLPVDAEEPRPAL